MIRLYRGDVILVYGPDGNQGLKPRYAIVHKDYRPEDKIITIYCTTQNDGNDSQNIFVAKDSEEGINMDLKDDTYIRPHKIVFVPCKAFIRKIGRCSLMGKIDRMILDRSAI